MKIKFSEIRRDYNLDYEFNDEVIKAIYQDGNKNIIDTFDFTQLQEGDDLLEVDSKIPVTVIKSAKRINGELEVVLLKPYEKKIAQLIMNGGDFPFSRDWQVV